MSQTAPALGNPTGGAVVAGAATIGSADKTLTINQATNNAIINWQSFSIASGETTKFVVPTSASATLNRVVGGNPSAIFGTLQSNGQVFLINPSGILVGAGGRIDTAGFLGSTLDVSNDEFMAGGNMHFFGDSTAKITNKGQIDAEGGSVYLIADKVNNKGTITASQGDVGLAAGSSILFQPVGDQHLFIQPTPSDSKRALAVNNSGTIKAASAELRSAGGNAYALAINNTGSIVATGYKKINGQVYLTSDSGNIANSGSISAVTSNGQGGQIHVSSKTGSITNSGKLAASATAASGKGGSVSVKSTSGVVSNAGGEIDAKGGQGGDGGQVELSGGTVKGLGTVNTTAAGGTTGNLLIDPATFTVAASGGDETGTVLGDMLDSTNMELEASNTITIDDTVAWSGANTLTLTTTSAGSTIAINAPIVGSNGGSLTINAASATDQITTGASGSINVSNFTLARGFWNQNNTTLASFAVSGNFQIQSGTFLRAAGGDGTDTPYNIVDVYGLQGLGSPSGLLLNANANLGGNIDATGTANWNNGAGFVSIGNSGTAYGGTFNGQGFTINGLTINTPTANDVGLFGNTSSGAALKNVNLTNATVTGFSNVGALAGNNAATVTDSNSAGVVTGTQNVGGLIGQSTGSISGSSTFGTVHGAAVLNGNSIVSSPAIVGGLVGHITSATISNSFSTAAVNVDFNGSDVGGLVGESEQSNVNSSFSTGTVNASGSSGVGGLIGFNTTDGVPGSSTIQNSYSTSQVSGASSTGGFIGFNNQGVVKTSYSAGKVTGSTLSVGGFIGGDASGTLSDDYYATDASTQSSAIGGTSSGTTITYVGQSTSNVTGLTLTQMTNQSNFDSNWDFTNVWTSINNTNLPIFVSNGSGGGGPGSNTDLLSGTAFLDSGSNADPGAVIDLIFNGQVLQTTTADSQGNYSFNVSTSELSTNGILLTNTTPNNNGNTFYQADVPASTITGVDIWGDTLRVMANVASNSLLGAVISGLSGHGIDYSVSGANLTTNTGVNMNVLSRYTLDGNITASGSFTAGSNAELTGSNSSVTITGQSVALSGSFDFTGGLNVTSTTGGITFDNLGFDTAAQAHSLTLTSAGAININNSFLLLTGGDMFASGTGFMSTTNSTGIGQADGVDVFNSTIDSEGGNIVLQGTAGYFFNNDESVNGVSAGTGVTIGSSMIETSGQGSIIVTGNGSLPPDVTSLTGMVGVDINNRLSDGTTGSGSSLTVGAGNIAISGTLSGTSTGNVVAVNIEDGSQIASTSPNGTVGIIGDASGATVQGDQGQGSIGVIISDTDPNFTTQVSVADGGNLVISGTGGAVTGAESDTVDAQGVLITGNTSITGGNGSALGIVGTAGANSDGVDIFEAPGDEAPLVPNISSSGQIIVTSLQGGALIDASVTGTGANGASPILVQETGGNLVLGPNAVFTNSGSGNNVTLVAGSAANPGFLVNASSQGADVFVLSGGAHFFVYSEAPSGDTFNGIAALDGDTHFNASFPGSSSVAPTGTGALLYFSGNSGNGGGGPTGPPGGGDGGDGNNPGNPGGGLIGSTGGGSNIVPPAIVPQNPQLTTQPTGIDTGLPNNGIPPILSTGNGNGNICSNGIPNNSLDSATGISGLIGPDDSAELSDGVLNNTHNPFAAGALSLALGPAVEAALADAMAAFGDSVPASTDMTTGNPGEDIESTPGSRILNSGDTVVIGGGNVSNISPSDAPPALQNALGNDIRHGLPGGH